MAVGLTVMVEPVAPVDHTIVPPSHPVALKVALEPTQMVSVAQLTTGGVTEITTTVLAFDAPLTHSPTLQIAV